MIVPNQMQFAQGLISKVATAYKDEKAPETNSR